jgi:hypothetical protein
LPAEDMPDEMHYEAHYHIFQLSAAARRQTLFLLYEPLSFFLFSSSCFHIVSLLRYCLSTQESRRCPDDTFSPPPLLPRFFIFIRVISDDTPLKTAPRRVEPAEFVDTPRFSFAVVFDIYSSPSHYALLFSV